VVAPPSQSKGPTDSGLACWEPIAKRKEETIMKESSKLCYEFVLLDSLACVLCSARLSVQKSF